LKFGRQGHPLLVEEDAQAVLEACVGAIERLHRELPDREVSCLLRTENVLRNVAHAAELRVVYEIPHDWGGVLWRAVDEGTTQFVPDVKADADYLAQDESIRAEIAVPVWAGDDVVGALNVESTTPLGEREVKIAERAAEDLGSELAKLTVSSIRR
jgi:putative methionine-R-sulfoxide reductase with GAF domain